MSDGENTILIIRKASHWGFGDALHHGYSWQNRGSV